MLAHELRFGVDWPLSKTEPKERLYAALQKMFPTSTDENGNEVKSLTESYYKYKQEYVRHLGFNPHNKNLSESI